MLVREGYKQTEIGVIPEEWEVTSVRDLTKLTSGKFNPKKNLLDTKSIEYKYPVYGGNGLTGYFDDFLIENPSIIIGRVGEYCGSVHLVNEPVWITDNAIYLKEVSDKVNLNFLLEVFTSIGIENLAERTGQPKITQEPIYSLKIPLPPLPEQQKIAAILTSVDSKIAVIDEQIAKTEQLKKGLMQKLLSEGIGHTEFKESEIGRIPEGWEVVQLKQIGTIVTGSTPKTSIKEYYENGRYLWASPSDLGKTKKVRSTSTKLSNLGFEQTRKIPPNSVLVTCIGSTIGKIGLAIEEMSTNQQINSLVCDEKNDGNFYYYVLDSKKDYIKNLAGTQAVPLLNKSDFSIIKVPHPPLAEQKQIATILSTADSKLDTLREKKSRYEKLKKGLMQKLLTGEVRVKITE